MIEIPEQILRMIPDEYHELADDMFQDVWHKFLKDKSSTSTTYWYDRFDNSKVFNKLLLHLSKAGWIIVNTEPKANWSDISFNEDKLDKYASKDRIKKMRQVSKYNKYKLGNKTKDTDNLTKTSKGVRDTGIKRPGQAKASHTRFKFDTDMMIKYQYEIILEVTKGIRKLEAKYGVFNDDVDYKAIATAIVEGHIHSPEEEYTLGGHISDGRGRAISRSLNKVFNPVSFKLARSVLITPDRELTPNGMREVNLFIAELLGYKPKTEKEKAQMGRDAYLRRAYKQLDLETDEGREELYENIWLERIYDMFDRYDGTNWNVPIEKDATALTEA